VATPVKFLLLLKPMASSILAPESEIVERLKSYRSIAKTLPFKQLFEPFKKETVEEQSSET
jgi:hypothetical protein